MSDPPPIIPNLGIFELLSGEVVSQLVQASQCIQCSIGAELTEVGDPCLGLYLILSGRVKVDALDALSYVTIAELGAGDVFGSMEWLSKAPWEERLVASEETELLFVPSDRLSRLNVNYPNLQQNVERYTERNILLTLIGAHDLFQNLNDSERMILLRDARMRQHTEGTVLFDPTRRLSVLFLIAKGEVHLHSGAKIIQVLGRGAVLNVELALGDHNYELSATTSSSTMIYTIQYEYVAEVLSQSGRMIELVKLAHQRRARAFGDL